MGLIRKHLILVECKFEKGFNVYQFRKQIKTSDWFLYETQHWVEIGQLCKFTNDKIYVNSRAAYLASFLTCVLLFGGY